MMLFTRSPPTTTTGPSSPSSLASSTPVQQTAAIPHRSRHADSKTDDAQPVRSPPATTPPESKPEADADVDMVKRSLSPSALPNSVDDSLTRLPSTPASPVQIPKHASHNRHFQTPHPVRRGNNARRRTPQNVHSPDSLSPEVAALLAITDIPLPRRSLKKTRKADAPLTVDEIISNEKQLSEKEMSWTFSNRGSPMDVLMSPPESLDDDYFTASDCNLGCPMARTLSVESMPSLGESFGTIESPRSPSPLSSRRRLLSLIRRSLEPIRSPPDSIDEHPLAPGAHDSEELVSDDLQEPDSDAAPATPLLPFKPLRAVFKSNLTASLRAIRSAAKSFSSINFPSIPPDDFLTRSLLTMDPKVPYADERRPPVTEEMPSAELRRYLNPTTRLSREKQPGTLQPPGTCSASIQMQTYKVQRSRSTSLPARSPYPLTSPQSPSAATTSNQPPSRAPSQSQSPPSPSPPPLPAMRQREMRENPDFIRIAVMEMAMRRRGKLDGNKPGRARWALPPKKTATKLYEIGADGVPARWIPISF